MTKLKDVQKNLSLNDLLAQAPRTKVQIADERTKYMGPCIVQAPGGWARVGPTWLTPVGWVVVGPGIANWGTSRGLAELAQDAAASPKWHAIGVAVVPTPNIVYAVSETALAAEYMSVVRNFAAQVQL